MPRSAIATAHQHKIKDRLLIFDTHPIQYRSPVFSELYQRNQNLKVFFFNHAFDGNKWWFHEVGKIPKQEFGLQLREGFPNEVLGTGHWGMFETYSRLKKILQEQNPATVLIYGYYLKEHWILRLLCRRLNIPLLFVGESFSPASSAIRRLLREPALRFFFKGISHFIAIGSKTYNYYERRGIPENRLSKARYCTETKLMQLPPKHGQKVRANIRDELGIPSSAFVVLFVGRLFDRKRPKDVLALHSKFIGNENVHTIIVGNGPLETELRARGDRTPCLHFAGFQNQHRIRDFYHASDLLFVPSEYETWGLVVNEAAVTGLPALITSNCGVAEDLVIHERTGFIFPVGNIAAAARITEDLVRHPSFLQSVGKRVQQKVLSEYRADHFAESILNACNQALTQ